MTAAEFEARIVDWARQEPGLEALVLAGSRAKAEATADDRADWDLHLITRRPRDYQGIGWLDRIAPCWCAHAGVTPRGVVKVSAVFQKGWEVDFIPLAAWQMKVVYAAMRRPGWTPLMPARLVRGIHETRAFLLGSGYRVLVGGPAWSGRLGALAVDWPAPVLPAGQFAAHQAAFWPQAVWLQKKIAREEFRSAIHWLSKLSVEHVYPLLQEEARLDGRTPRPEARKAEQWLAEPRLRQTAITLAPDRRALAAALLQTIELFNEVGRAVAARRGFAVPPHAEVEAWLRGGLERLR